MELTEPFPSGFPLQGLPELSEEVFFAFHSGIKKMLYLNAAFEHVWHIPRNEAVSDLSLITNSVYPDDRKYVAESFAVLQKTKKQQIDFRIEISEKAIKWIRVNAFVHQKNDTNIVIGTATDITGFKKFSHTLEKLNDKQNSILQILSHDLLSPLGNIKMSLVLLNEYGEIRNSKEIMEVVDIIHKNCQRGIIMVQDLINSEFLQASEATIVKDRVDIIEKIRETIGQFGESPANGHQRLSFEHSMDTLFVNIDTIKFMHVINNLLNNALKFTPDDGKITIGIEDENKDFLIKVQDTGIGISLDMQPYLFDKFTRARRPGIKGEPSTGLGMSIIKKIVDWHNGHIWFESEEGKGSTFYIRIPKGN